MADEKAQAAPKPAGQSPVATILGLLLPALLAGAAAFGGARFAAAGGAHPKVVVVKETPPPGPTLALEPFIFTVNDGSHKTHAVKVSLAVEFKPAKNKDEDLKTLVPRVRDACLAYLRTLTYEATTTQGLDDKAREELLSRIRQQGAGEAEKVLVTDFVVQ
jgi:flagellar basal body-associated protein FliL